MKNTKQTENLDLGEIHQQFINSLPEEPVKLDINVADKYAPHLISAAFKKWKEDNTLVEEAKVYKPRGQSVIIHLFYFKPSSVILNLEGRSDTTGIQLFPFAKVLAASKKAIENDIEVGKIYYLNKSLFVGFHQPYDWTQGVPKSEHQENSVILAIDRPDLHIILDYNKKSLDYMFTRILDTNQILAKYEGSL